VIGGGIEQMVSPNWLWRVEYLYENFGTFDVPHGLRGVSTAIDMDHVHKLRIGITYKFGEPSISDIAAGSRIKF
jgi:opacity protein-like surface antigen